MKLACNYYPETEELVRAGKIDIDYFKFPALGYQMDVLYDLRAFKAFVEKAGAVRPICAIQKSTKRAIRFSKSCSQSVSRKLSRLSMDGTMTASIAAAR